MMGSHWWQPLVSGLVGTLVVYLLMRSARKPAPRKNGVRVLAYTAGFRVFAALLIPGAAFVAYAAAHARRDQLPIATVVAGFFIVSAVLSAYQAFFVQLSYDDRNIYYRSPLAGARTIPWSDVRQVGYSRLLQAHYLRTPLMSRIWCSSMLRGFDELGEFLAARRKEPEP